METIKEKIKVLDYEIKQLQDEIVTLLSENHTITKNILNEFSQCECKDMEELKMKMNTFFDKLITEMAEKERKMYLKLYFIIKIKRTLLQNYENGVNIIDKEIVKSQKNTKKESVVKNSKMKIIEGIISNKIFMNVSIITISVLVLVFVSHNFSEDLVKIMEFLKSMKF